MSLKKYCLAFILLILISSCTVHKTLRSTGGSKSDGIVDLSYSIGLFETAKVDWDKGLRDATRRCVAWGYQSAEAFGGSTSECRSYNGYGNCLDEVVTITYQCIGNH